MRRARPARLRAPVAALPLARGRFRLRRLAREKGARWRAAQDALGEPGESGNGLSSLVFICAPIALARTVRTRLTVTIVEAQGLRESSLGGHSEPFCVVKLIDADGQPLPKLHGNRKMTKTVPRTVNPKWGEAIQFGGPECDLAGVWGVSISIRSKRSLVRVAAAKPRP